MTCFVNLILFKLFPHITPALNQKFLAFAFWVISFMDRTFLFRLIITIFAYIHLFDVAITYSLIEFQFWVQFLKFLKSCYRIWLLLLIFDVHIFHFIFDSFGSISLNNFEYNILLINEIIISAWTFWIFRFKNTFIRCLNVLLFALFLFK